MTYLLESPGGDEGPYMEENHLQQKFSGIGVSVVEFLPVIFNKIKVPLTTVNIWWFTAQNESIQKRWKKKKKKLILDEALHL